MRSLRAIAVSSLAFVALLTGAQAAWGHAAYKSSEPPDGGRVTSPPGRVTAEFTEPLAGGSYLRVTDPCGARVDNGDVSISGFTMSVSMDAAAAGGYVVFYRAHSQLDPHIVEGEFTFTVTSGEICAGSEDEPDNGPDSGGGASGSNGTTGSNGATGSSEDSGGSTQASGSTSRGADRSSGSGNREASGRRSRSDDLRPGERRARVANIAAPAEEDTERNRAWDGIPLDAFLTGLLLAAIIGAAGGKIYAGIMGPRA